MNQPASRSPSRNALSVVVIARNEAAYISRCLASVLSASTDIPDCDVVFVDSRSTDATVELARRFPIRVVRLHATAPLSRPLARVVGQRLTTGRYVLFVDGDTTINAEWLHAAVRLLEERADVAGVAGKLHEVYYQQGVAIGENPDFFGSGDSLEDAYQLGGNALYRREALDSVGSFNPSLVSLEEAELAERLRAAGYRLMRLPIRLGTHHTPARDSLREPWRRCREGLMIGYGQVLRLSLRNGTFWCHAREMNRFLLFTLFELVGCVLLGVSVWLRDARILLAWALVGLVPLLLMMLRSRSVRRPLSVFGDWALAGPAILWGMIRQTQDLRDLSVDSLIEQPDLRDVAQTDHAQVALLRRA